MCFPSAVRQEVCQQICSVSLGLRNKATWSRTSPAPRWPCGMSEKQKCAYCGPLRFGRHQLTAAEWSIVTGMNPFISPYLMYWLFTQYLHVNILHAPNKIFIIFLWNFPSCSPLYLTEWCLRSCWSDLDFSVTLQSQINPLAGPVNFKIYYSYIYKCMTLFDHSCSNTIDHHLSFEQTTITS